MVKAYITEKGFTLDGHAPRPPGAKDNTLCAAVSVLAQTTRDALQEVAGFDVRAEMESGHLSAEWDEEPTRESDTILEVLLVGLRHLAESFPGSIEIETS